MRISLIIPFVILTAFLSVSSSALHAQTIGCLEQGGSILDTFTVSIPVNAIGNSLRFSNEMSLNGGQQNGNLVWLVVGSSTSGGSLTYIIDASSVTFSGDGSIIDGIATGPLFSLMAQATIQQGVQFGYTPCSDTCGSNLPTRVMQAACVDRAGSGIATHFTPCGTDCCWREYTVCCSGGSTTLTLTGTGGGVCSGTSLASGCEPTCSGEWTQNISNGDLN